MSDRTVCECHSHPIALCPDQPTALRLADALDALAEKFNEGWHDGITIDTSDILDSAEAAAELRRLHAENEALRVDAMRSKT